MQLASVSMEAKLEMAERSWMYHVALPIPASLARASAYPGEGVGLGTLELGAVAVERGLALVCLGLGVCEPGGGLVEHLLGVGALGVQRGLALVELGGHGGKLVVDRGRGGRDDACLGGVELCLGGLDESGELVGGDVLGGELGV